MPPSTRPNILLLLADQHRPDYVGWNPAVPVRTPNLNAIAAQGVRFTNAYTPSPLCAPARACLASGRGYDRCGVPDNDHDYPLDQPTYYQSLRDAGYQVAGVGKFDLHKATLDWGIDGSRLLSEWGFTAGIDNEGKIDGIRSGADVPAGPYMAFLHALGLAAAHVDDLRNRHGYRDTHATPLPDDAYCDNWVANNGLHVLENLSTEQPWHLVVNFTGPHNPMDVTASMRERWQEVAFPPPHRSTQYDAATHQRIRQNYAAMIENIDRLAGRFIDVLRSRSELENTMVIYSSDHGEMLGDHDRWGKSSWRQPSVGIPLVVSGPGIPRGHVSEELVSLHDLAPTFLDYARAEHPPSMDACSLRPSLEGRETTLRKTVISALDGWRTIFDGQFKLVTTQGDTPQLFDLVRDPDEDHDLALQDPSTVKRLLDEATIADGETANP